MEVHQRAIDSLERLLEKLRRLRDESTLNIVVGEFQSILDVYVGLLLTRAGKIARVEINRILVKAAQHLSSLNVNFTQTSPKGVSAAVTRSTPHQDQAWRAVKPEVVTTSTWLPSSVAGRDAFLDNKYIENALSNGQQCVKGCVVLLHAVAHQSPFGAMMDPPLNQAGARGGMCSTAALLASSMPAELRRLIPIIDANGAGMSGQPQPPQQPQPPLQPQPPQQPPPGQGPPPPSHPLPPGQHPTQQLARQLVRQLWQEMSSTPNAPQGNQHHATVLLPTVRQLLHEVVSQQPMDRVPQQVLWDLAYNEFEKLVDPRDPDYIQDMQQQGVRQQKRLKDRLINALAALLPTSSLDLPSLEPQQKAQVIGPRVNALGALAQTVVYLRLSMAGYGGVEAALAAAASKQSSLFMTLVAGVHLDFFTEIKYSFNSEEYSSPAVCLGAPHLVAIVMGETPEAKLLAGWRQNLAYWMCDALIQSLGRLPLLPDTFLAEKLIKPLEDLAAQHVQKYEDWSAEISSRIVQKMVASTRAVDALVPRDAQHAQYCTIHAAVFGAKCAANGIVIDDNIAATLAYLELVRKL